MSEPLVPVPRRVRPWQPNPALLLVSTARAFAAAHWEDVRQHGSVQTAAMADDVLEADEDSASARPFTDDGLVRPHDGFEPLKIRPFNEPLSELSRQALQRFNAEQAAAHPLGEEPLHLDAHVADDHAQAIRAYRSDPLLQRASFVPDVYEFDEEEPDAPIDATADDAFAAQDDETLTDDEGQALMAECDAQDASLDAAQAQGDDGSSEQAEPISDATSNEASDEASNTASEATKADDAELSATPHSDAEHAADEADAPVLDEQSAQQTDPAAESEAQTHHAQGEEASSPQAQADEPEDSEPHPALTAEPQAPAAEVELADVTLSESDLANADVMAPQDLLQAEQDAVQAAVDAAWQEAQPEPLPGIDAEELARREAEQYQLGYAEGERIARDAMAQEIAAQRTVMEGVTRELHALLNEPQRFFEPLKRLAVHVAEQVVLSELKSSSQTIERLIERCLETLDHPTQGMVVLELNPQDKARLLETAPDLTKGMRIDAVEAMHPGSVRVFANDTIVEDLVEHRLQALVRGLNLNEPAWAARSALLHVQDADAGSDVGAQSQSQLDNQSESDDVHP